MIIEKDDSFSTILIYVDSHQDKKNKFKTISEPVQVSIEADRLADIHRKSGKSDLLSPLCSSTKAQLLME